MIEAKAFEVVRVPQKETEAESSVSTRQTAR